MADKDGTAHLCLWPQLMRVRNGPGAAQLPAEVTKIHLEFAMLNKGGHMGSRMFWRENLPRLKYWNPGVPMIVNRTRDPDGPATLSIYMRRPAAAAAAAAATGPWAVITSSTTGAAPAPSPADGETVVRINTKNALSEDILAVLMANTGAVPIVTSTEDADEIERLTYLRERAVYDREIDLRTMARMRAEKDLLEKARQEADALKASL